MTDSAPSDIQLAAPELASATSHGPACPSRARGRAGAAIALVLLACLIAVARLHTYNEPFERDITSYILQAREIVHGKKLYTDLPNEYRPPAIYATWAVVEAIVGRGPLPVYVANVLATVTTMLGVYVA